MNDQLEEFIKEHVVNPWEERTPEQMNDPNNCLYDEPRYPDIIYISDLRDFFKDKVIFRVTDKERKELNIMIETLSKFEPPLKDKIIDLDEWYNWNCTSAE